MENSKVQKNCFAYSNRECKILTELVCAHRKCSFCKTREQYDVDRLKYDAVAQMRTCEKNTPGEKPVVCCETGRVFPSVSAAARFACVTVSAVSACLSGRKWSAGGYHFEYWK